MTITSCLLERASRIASRYHAGQFRKQSKLPYISHLLSVAIILQRAGFQDEETLAAALLHDILEDTGYTATQLENEFPPRVAQFVKILSERKYDNRGHNRPWSERKREHIERIKNAPLECRAILLADKLHNLQSIQWDLDAGQSVWERFNAPQVDVVRYHRKIVTAAEANSPELKPLADECRTFIVRLESETSTPRTDHQRPAK
ncbi:MAG: HD domain-containing protein [Planctomycetaceae bacterium]